MNMIDVAGPLLIALGSLPLAVGMARLALKVVVAAMIANQESTAA